MKAVFLYSFSLVNLIRYYEKKTELQKLFNRVFMLSCLDTLQKVYFD